MTFHGAMGLVYIGAIIIAAFSFTIIVTMKSRKIINLENENFYLLIVATCLLLINILYFLIDYYSIIINYYRSGGLIRVLDIWLAISMQFAWFMLLKEILFKDMARRLWFFIKCGYIILLVVTFINYGFIMEEGYFVEDKTLKTLSVILELTVSGLLISINLILAVLIIKKIYREKAETAVKKFTLIATIVIAIDGMQNTKASINLVLGNIGLHEDYGNGINVTAIARLIFGICLLWYVVKHCFLEQYQRSPETAIAGKKLLNEEARLQNMAGEAGLTERETVIMKLLYAGSTYQDIADFLYISKNTVKHHITSIYKKLGVASKMDLINTVRMMDKHILKDVKKIE